MPTLAGTNTAPVVAVLVPVLGRPHRVAELLADLDAATPAGSWQAVFIVDPDDHATIEACAAAGADWIADWSACPTYASKINTGAAATCTPWVLTAADDVHFHPGWLDAGLEVAETGALVIGTNDLLNQAVIAGRHSTHTLVARSYIDDPGACVDGPGLVMHPNYPHEYCDDELVVTAQRRRVWAHAPRCIVEHRHHSNGGRPHDWVDVKAKAGRAVSRQMFHDRLALIDAAT